MKTWDEMTARERDVLVATEIMGWTVTESETHVPYVTHENAGGASHQIIGPGDWSPSTDIAAAWEVVEKMRVWLWTIEWHKPTEEWAASPETGVWGRADTAPEAICLAALRAKGVDV